MNHKEKWAETKFKEYKQNQKMPVASDKELYQLAFIEGFDTCRKTLIMWLEWQDEDYVVPGRVFKYMLEMFGDSKA